MTQTPSKPSTPDSGTGKKSGSKVWMIIAILLLIGLLAALYFFLPMKEKYKTMIEEKEQDRIELQSELDNLLIQHDSIKEEYGELADSLAIKDSLILSNAKEIQQLLNYKWEYRKVNRKLELLRSISKGYVHQLDSLYTVNSELKEENEKIRQQYNKEQSKTRELTRDNETLIEKVSQATVLKAYNVEAIGVRFTGSGRERETDRAKKIERVNVCFTLGENKLTAPGTKTVYIRIVRPDGVVVTQKAGGDYSFEFQSQNIDYSIKKEVDYQNKDTYMCMFWAKKTDDPAMEGTYNITVYSDGYEIGKSSFDLR